MPTKPSTHEEVSSVCDHLEVSPSSHSPGSDIYGGSDKEPKAKLHSPKHKSGSKGHMTNSESEFGSGRRTAVKNTQKSY